MSALLRVDALDAGYGGVQIVFGVSLEVAPAEIVTIIGPNGAGKSTLLKAICGAITPLGGAVYLGDSDVTGIPAHRMAEAGAAFVPQTENVFPSLTIRENLEMGGYRLGSAAAARIDTLLRQHPDLGRRPDLPAGRLSGGQRQTLAILRALMMEPRLLLLDEPSAALSPSMRADVFKEIVRVRDRGVAVLMVEQNAREALRASDRGVVLVSGRKALEQPATELLANPDVGRLFLGNRTAAAAADANETGAGEDGA